MPEAHVEVLLIGGGVASVRCARTLRRRGFAGSILIVGDESHAPYNRPPLTKELLREDVPAELVSAEPAAWYERHGVGLRTGIAVERLDAHGRLVTLADGSRIGFERCLVATGAAPRRPPIPGAEHVLLLRTLDDAVRLRSLARPGVRAVVIGGGFIGIEAASSMAARGASVTILELAPLAWGGILGEQLSGWAIEVLAADGVALRTGVVATGVDADAVWIGDERLAADLILAGVGVRPRVELAREAGLECDDGVVTNGDHATAVPGIFAAGDVARVAGRRVEHWHAAREGGERAALAMLGEELGPARAPWVFSEFAGQQLDVVGHAPTWDETVVLGDSGRGTFSVGFLREGKVAQLAVVNAAIPVDEARSRLEAGMRADDLAQLASLG